MSPLRIVRNQYPYFTTIDILIMTAYMIFSFYSPCIIARSLAIFAFHSGDVHFTMTYGRFPITTSRFFNPSYATFWSESYRNRRSGNLFTAPTLWVKVSSLSFLFFSRYHRLKFQSHSLLGFPISNSIKFSSNVLL